MDAMCSLQRAAQRALLDADGEGFVPLVCEALAAADGMVGAALFVNDAHEGLSLAAQAGALDVSALVDGSRHLELVSTRPGFPGLQAALSGEPSVLMAEQAHDDAELAQALRAHRVGVVAGVPLAAPQRGCRGALCLLFGERAALSANELTSLAEIGRLLDFGLRVAELQAARQRLAQQLERVSATDPASGAANRRHAELVLVREIERSGRHGTPLTVLLFAIDGFAQLQAQHGAAAGEQALKEVARATQAKLRDADLLARWDDARFAIVAPHTDAAGAATLGEKLHDTVARLSVPGVGRLAAKTAAAQLLAGESLQALLQRLELMLSL